MENARSLASRFSGLLLFILSLAVVGVLVFLTIRSARDQDQVTTGPDNVPAESQAEDNAVTTGAEPADESPSAAEESRVAADTDGDLPNTGPESMFVTAAALSVLAFMANSYVDSRRQLKSLSRR